MKKDSEEQPEMRDEYDFSSGQRGKYAKRYAEGTNLVLIDPNLRDVFPDSASVNKALREIANTVRARPHDRCASLRAFRLLARLRRARLAERRGHRLGPVGGARRARYRRGK